MTTEKKNTSVKKEPNYNYLQACVMLKLGRYDRIVVEKKYKDKELTIDGWKKLLKNDKLKF